MSTVVTHASRALLHSFELPDGTRLVYREWRPSVPTRRTVVLFHRGHEHSGRLADVAAGLGLRDTAIFAWDARGHGLSDGERGDAPSFGAIVADVDAFLRHLVDAHGVRLEDTIVLGHSVGAVAVAAWVHDFAPPIRALVLATPAFRVKLYVPFARAGLRALRAIAGRPRFVSSYVKGALLTHDPEEARAYDEDDLVSRRISVRVLLGLHDAATRLLADAAAIRVPTLVLAGGADWVVRVDVVRGFVERLGSSIKRLVVFDGMYHDVLHERGRDRVVDAIRRFVEEAFARGVEPAPLDADARGHTRDEADRLAAPLPAHSLARLRYRALAAFLRTVGRLSRGIRLGWREGFDSGHSLDYVYANRARGTTPLGRVVDRCYLDSPGWRGVRVRRTNLETLLREEIRAAAPLADPVRVLDVAAGHGRSVLETIDALPEIAIHARLRDNAPANVEAMHREVERRRRADVVVELGDAFDRDALHAIEPRVDVAVVSGLYELFSDNTRVLGSLAGLANAVRPGGALIYTNQPWHPQLELIARTLRNREGRPWVMRRRTQAEMDALVAAAGFVKERTLVDEEGIFTVSIARRR